ncbi:FAD-dependent monooxygenase [Nocardia beijingensis]|uniref:FAD-dependent oxidoreductase n=1 Tax=Nocardia beijingensis TaxID=95162 RepID=UPI0018937BAD|nr:FAD-dependent monooxygenase [Nocardia beijingensis]MBF6470086.1 FAD-dependent monooxygenase [Nocardia beijingensis]
MSGSARDVFEHLLWANPPDAPESRFGTACVIGGSIAGLLAARVLADYARRVVVIERNEVAGNDSMRSGVPHGQQVHVLLPAGLVRIERLLPGFADEAYALGAVPAAPERASLYFDNHPCLQTRHEPLMLATRPFLEARIRARVLALPNVVINRGRAVGFDSRKGAVSGVRYMVDGAEYLLETDFVVDAMGRGSKLSTWLEQAGFDRPQLQRLPSGINYATALFERARDDELSWATTLVQHSPGRGPRDIALSVTSAVESRRWIVMLMAHHPVKPPRTVEEFRELCAHMPPPFPEAVGGALVREIVTYHQRDSRRRDFAGPLNLPARLVSVGDAVASFNPAFGQGMSSAALHSSCLNEYLRAGPDLDLPARQFFDLQLVVVDAAWQVSAGSDAARLDALNNAEVPEEVRRRRWALEQITAAAVTDHHVAQKFRDVTFMLEHPDRLADPTLLERAVTANGAKVLDCRSAECGRA